MSRARLGPVPAPAGLLPLVRGLCQDASVQVRQGPRWCYEPATRTFELDARWLAVRPLVALGITAHEAGHCWVTRYDRFRPLLAPQAAWLALMNALEEARANGFQARRYPGCARWLDAMRARDRTAKPRSASRFVQFLNAAAYADAWDWRPPPWLQPHPEALRAYQATGPARQTYADTLPPPDLAWDKDAGALETAFLTEVRPRLADAYQDLGPAPGEMVVLVHAARALAIVERHILPVAERLLAHDLAALAAHLARQPEGCGEQLASDPEKALRQVANALEGVPEPSRPDPLLRELAGRLLAAWLERQELPAAVILRTGRHPATAAAEALDASATAARIAPQLAPLTRALAAALAAPPRWRSGFASGRRLDLGRAMAFAATRRDPDRLWRRRQPASTCEAAVGLLIDASGSMAGEAATAAATGGLLLAEALARLAPKVRLAIDLFQDELIPIKSFAEPWDDRARAALLALPLEVAGCRPGGHNRPRYNDDAPCLEEHARKLRRQPGRRRLLLIVSDGRPAGRRSTVQDLKQVVARLGQPGAGLELVGLGIGPGTAHVKEFYPVALADIPLERFTVVLGDLLRRMLAGGRR